MIVKPYEHEIDVEIGQDYTKGTPDNFKLTEVPKKTDVSKIIGKPFVDFSVSFRESSPIELAPPIITQFPTGKPVYQALELTDNTGEAPYTWDVDVLPNGLDLTDEGVITGTPVTQGEVTSVITATDSANTTSNITVNWTII